VWPHPITIGLEGTAISIGTDDPEVVARLEPWRIPDVGYPIDYCLELHPAAVGRGQPRSLPGLYHGSTTLLRSRDAARLITTFLRVLGSHARPATEGQVRVGLMPIVRDGLAFLAPSASIGAVLDRWMAAQGIEAIHTVSSLVDADRAQVLVDPPLGSDDAPMASTFVGWWLQPTGWDEVLSPGFAVAEVMDMVTGVTAANAASSLRSVATLVERAHPDFAPTTLDGLKEGLAKVLELAAPQ